MEKLHKRKVKSWVFKLAQLCPGRRERKLHFRWDIPPSNSNSLCIVVCATPFSRSQAQRETEQTILALVVLVVWSPKVEIFNVFHLMAHIN